MTAHNHDEQPPAEKAADTKDVITKEAEHFFGWIQLRTEELISRGFREGHARLLGYIEGRLNQWPSAWGEDLQILIYGDFHEPSKELNFPELGIKIMPEKVIDSVIKSAICVLRAHVKVSSKTIESLVDASKRIDTLLGVLVALGWGNSGIGWWSHVTHGSISGVMSELEQDKIHIVIDTFRKLPTPVMQKVQSALYWIREPRLLCMEGYQSDVISVYAGYWNAFECLVDAVCFFHPQPKISPSQKQADIDAFLSKRKGKLDAATISECYKHIVDRGFIYKASHALKVCFPDHAEQYVTECFKMKPEKDRLYNIRNAINHGEIDAGNIIEVLRVEDRHDRLWFIVFGMLGSIIPINRPLDHHVLSL